jgi:heptosyltransferase-2
MKPTESILIWTPAWVGDWVMATAAFDALRRARPTARIAAVARPGHAALGAGTGWFDEILTHEKGGSDDLTSRLRAGRFDTALLLPYSFRCAWTTWRAGIPRRIGFATQGRSPLLTERLRAPRERGRVTPRYRGEVYREILAAFGVEAPPSPLRLVATEAERREARDLLARHGARDGERFIGLNPGASFGPSKRWPAGHFARAGRLLSEVLGSRCLILSAPGEEAIEEEVASHLGAAGLSLAPDALALGTMKGLMEDLCVMVTNDTGPRHIAVAFGIPTVVLVGPMDPRYTDFPHPRLAVLRREVPCSPCNLPRCPIDHRCLRWIGPEEAVAAATRLLAPDRAAREAGSAPRG